MIELNVMNAIGFLTLNKSKRDLKFLEKVRLLWISKEGNHFQQQVLFQKKGEKVFLRLMRQLNSIQIHLRGYQRYQICQRK